LGSNSVNYKHQIKSIDIETALDAAEKFLNVVLDAKLQDSTVTTTTTADKRKGEVLQIE
jgi:hypothetical protein